nr:RNA-directed DNA polymerase, eukaryota, reverse transcriptase zinc-binding domain protein [Tanacetum cinerariifolium]
MECLHLSFQRVVDADMFTGIKLGNSINLSHMFYADDAVFIGTKVGGIMSRVDEWKEVIDKVQSRLSNWKMKALSIGGRFTLLRSVLGSIPLFYMSIFRVPSSVLHKLESLRSHFFNGHEIGSRKATWVKWNIVLADKEKGGLGVSSFYALNRCFMLKWIWRFYDHKNSLWYCVIKAIYGNDDNIELVRNGGNRSCWSSIIHEVNVLSSQGVNIFDYIRLKLGNSNMVSFWNDNWSGAGSAKVLYPRLYALENHKEVNVRDKISNSSLEMSFRRHIRGGAEQVQFDSLSSLISSVILVPYQHRPPFEKKGASTP